MKSRIAQDPLDFAIQATDWLEQKIAVNKSSIVQLPAGNTPIPIYEHWSKTRPEFLHKLRFQQVDDVLTGSKAGMFEEFFKVHLPYLASHFSPLGENPIQPDIAILGIGTNGHVAFHEPEIDISMNYACVKLSLKTCQSLQLEPNTWGISYGLGHFLKCKSILLAASGPTKKEILGRLLNPSGPAKLPVEFLLKHPDLTLLHDLV